MQFGTIDALDAGLLEVIGALLPREAVKIDRDNIHHLADGD